MGKLKARGESYGVLQMGMRAPQSLAQGVCLVPGPPSQAAASMWTSADLRGLWLGEGRGGWRGEGANYVKGYRVLPAAENHCDQALKELCSKEHWGVWEGILGRGPSLGKGSEARVQDIIFDVARKRMHGLRWMEEMRLDLISLALCRVGSACSH